MSDVWIGVAGTLLGAVVGGLIGLGASLIQTHQEHERNDKGVQKQLLSILWNVGTWFLVQTKIENARPVGDDDWQVGALFKILYSPEVAVMLMSKGDGVADAVYSAARKIQESNGSILYQRGKLGEVMPGGQREEIYAGMKRAAASALEAINAARRALGDGAEIRYPFEVQ